MMIKSKSRFRFQTRYSSRTFKAADTGIDRAERLRIRDENQVRVGNVFFEFMKRGLTVGAIYYAAGVTGSPWLDFLAAAVVFALGFVTAAQINRLIAEIYGEPVKDGKFLRSRWAFGTVLSVLATWALLIAFNDILAGTSK